MEDDIVENPEAHAKAGDRPEEGSWEGSEKDHKEFEKAAQVIRDGGKLLGPYTRKDGRQVVSLFEADGNGLGQIYNPKVIPPLLELWERIKAQRGPETKGGKKDEANMALAFIGRNPNFPLLKQVVENAAWYQSAMNEVGFTSLLIALQVGDLDPKTIAEEIEGFRDEEGGKEKFIHMINTRLQALLEAKTKAGRISELERQLVVVRAAKDLTELALNEALFQRNRFENHLHMAMASMCPPDMKKLMERQIYGDVLLTSSGAGNGQAAVTTEKAKEGTLIE